MNRLLLVSIFLFSHQLFGLDISRIQWGFNNRVKKQTFNVVSFEVINTTGRVYDSFISIEPYGMGVQTVIHKKLFLNPGQKKIVQFSCYIDQNYDDWRVKWENGGTTIPRAQESNGAFTYLSEGFSAVRLNKGISLFPDGLFPTTVSLTDDLDGVALDHNPDWSPLQKEAFMDWLKKGGALYILNDRSGTQPKFTSIMSDLNNPESRFYIGNGRVEREKLSIATFKKPFTDNSNRYNEHEPNSGEYFQALQYLVKTDHNWTLIYFLIFIYLLVIGPLNYLVGKRTRDWKVPNLFFLLSVIGFSILFSVIGRRGYGEETKLTSVSLADVLEDGQYDVQQWTNIFVTSGDLYHLSHNGTGNLYYSFSEIGKKTLIDADAGKFTADIPLFSSRRMIHRAKMKGPVIKAELVPSQSFDSAAVKISSEEMSIDSVWIIRKGKVYRTVNSSGVYEATREIDPYYGNNYYYGEQQDAYEEIEKMMISRLQMTRKSLYNSYRDSLVNPAMVYAVVRARTPASFHIEEKNSNIPGQETGWTYFRILINTDRAN